MLQNSVYFGVLISLGSYAIGMLLKRKTNWAFMNPLLVSIVLCIIVITLTGKVTKTTTRGLRGLAICSPLQPYALPCLFISKWNC